jgi:bacterioferritin
MFAKRAATLSCPTAQVLREQLLHEDPIADAARRRLGNSETSARNGPSRRDIVELLNVALATELVCAMRCKRHHFTAGGLASAEILEEFMVHAREQAVHADRLAQRIAQLGGKPDFSPDALPQRSLADYDDSLDLRTMIQAGLAAERLAIEGYGQTISLIGDTDPATRRLLEDIVDDERQHADKLRNWLVQCSTLCGT